MKYVVYIEIIGIITALILLFGCEQRYTYSQWLEMKPDPTDVNQALAQVTYETGIAAANAKIAHQKRMDNIQYAAVIVAGICVTATIILTYLTMTKLAFIPVAVFIAVVALSFILSTFFTTSVNALKLCLFFTK